MLRRREGTAIFNFFASIVGIGIMMIEFAAAILVLNDFMTNVSSFVPEMKKAFRSIAEYVFRR